MLKKLLAVIAATFISFTLYALPGISQYIQDRDGEFVYYRDMTFNRESYIGILTYDNSTYAIRYYAPACKDEEEKDLTIYFTMDPLKKYVEMTGEKIVGKDYMKEADTINYMHNIIYEFTKNRQNAMIVNEKCSLNADYLEFGGNVTINFDPIIPLFNIENICNLKGKKIFYLVTMGQLFSSEDTSFVDFKGIQETKFTKKVKISKGKKINFINTLEEGSDLVFGVELNDNWTKAADNVYLMGDMASASINFIKLPGSDFFNSTLRLILLGTDHQYPLSDKSLIKTSQQGSWTNYQITQPFQELNRNKTTIFNIYRYSDIEFVIFTLNIYSDVYYKNEKYFNKIAESFSCLSK